MEPYNNGPGPTRGRGKWATTNTSGGMSNEFPTVTSTIVLLVIYI
jgi:hypothetical protein